MIKNIFIKNFILIEQITLDFKNGYSTFTGETGAGKSILIDAISLLKADRASASFVMEGKDKAIIEGTFDLSDDTHALEILKENGFEEEDYYTFSREIYANSKSIVRLNGRVIPLSLMKSILINQLDIHGQRDNAYLLQSNNHITLLDKYLHLEDTLKNLKEKYNAYTALIKEKEDALNDNFNQSDLEYFQFQINEIEQAKLSVSEEEELKEKESSYLALKDSMDKLNTIEEIYERSVEGDTYELLKLIESLKDFDGLEKIQNQFYDAYYNMQDSINSIKDKKESFSFSEDEINEMEERLYAIQKLKRKYNLSIEGILNYKEELVQKVQRYDNKVAFIESIDKKIAQAEKEYVSLARSISKQRKIGALELDKEILSQLKELKLENAQFKTSITECDYTNKGIDSVEFMVAMNKGQKFSSLSTSASGGELSRLMLGLKVIFAHLQDIHTIIFDEIDTGVSGSVASSIGKKMKELSSTCQVFSVTHLSPVAAWADHQYLVSKEDKENSTRTTITELNEEERIAQLAFISSGEITEASKSAAKELLSRSHL